MSAVAKPTWKTWLRDAGIGVGFFLMFFYLTFPWEVVRQRIEVELASGLSSPQTTAQVAIGSVRSAWFTGVILDRVVLSRPDPDGGAPKAALIPELRLRVSLWSLLRGQTSVTFTTNALGGHLEGELLDSKKLDSLSLSGTGLQLTDAKDVLGFFGASSGMDLSALDLVGTAALKGDLAFKPNDFASLKGHLTLSVDHMVLKGGVVAEIELPQVDLGKFDLAAHAQEGKLDVDRFKIDSDDVSLESDGVFFTLNQNLGYSMPHGKIRVHFGEDLQKRIPYLGMGLSALKAPDREGFYSLPLGGTLKNPKIM